MVQVCGYNKALRTEAEIKHRLALMVDIIKGDPEPARSHPLLAAIRELEWVLEVREK